MDKRALTALRRRLHEMAELSGREARTAAFVAARLAAGRPATVLRGLGGHGVAAVYAANRSRTDRSAALRTGRTAHRRDRDHAPRLGRARHRPQMRP